MDTEEPVAVLSQRVEQLTELATREREAEQKAGGAEQQLERIRSARDLLRERLGQQRERLEEPAALLIARASALAPNKCS